MCRHTRASSFETGNEACISALKWPRIVNSHQTMPVNASSIGEIILDVDNKAVSLIRLYSWTGIGTYASRLAKILKGRVDSEAMKHGIRRRQLGDKR